MKKILLLLCAVAALFTACQKTNEGPPAETIKSISLGRDTLTMRIGQTYQLTITTTPDGHNKEVNLSSSDTTVVSVKSDGKLTAKKNGTAVITATNQQKTISVTCLVTVVDIPDPLKGVLFTDTLTMYADDVVQLHYTTTPPNYDPALLVWKSSDSTVVSVSSTGKVTAKKEGLSTVSLTNKAKTFSISGIISVKNNLNFGLLAFYPFNNSTNDFSGNNNNGVGYSLTTGSDRFGKSNSAYYFGGFSSYIRVSDNTALRLSNTDFTLNSWVKLDGYGYTFGVNILSKHISGADNGWAWGITGYQISTIGVVTYGPGGGSAFARGVLTVGLNQWHMVTSVYRVQNQSISIYVDGALDNVTYGQPSPKNMISSDLYIGRDNPEVPTDGYFVKGALDDIRIYNRTLSSEEIKRLYNLTY